MYFDKLTDILMFRSGVDDDGFQKEPTVTIGSIVWGVLLRTTIVFIAVFFLINFPKFRDFWWVSFFGIWFFVAFPAYRQYQNYQNRIDDIEVNTLCGSCVHFRKDAQMCSLFDEHISKDYIPCGGENWEPKSTFDGD